MAEEKKEYNVGWLWVVAIVVIVAIVLYVNQKTTAPETEVIPEDQTTDTEEVMEEEGEMVAEFGDYGIEFSYIPEAAPIGAQFGVDWIVTTPEATTTDNTGLYFGTTTRTIAEGTNPSPKEVNYPGSTTGYIGTTIDVPYEFESVIPAYTYATTIYIRAHAEVDGVHYWSDEKQIIIEQK